MPRKKLWPDAASAGPQAQPPLHAAASRRAPPVCAALGGAIDAAQVVEFVDAGRDVLLAVDSDVSEELRSLAQDLGVDIDARWDGQWWRDAGQAGRCCMSRAAGGISGRALPAGQGLAQTSAQEHRVARVGAAAAALAGPPCRSGNVVIDHFGYDSHLGAQDHAAVLADAAVQSAAVLPKALPTPVLFRGIGLSVAAESETVGGAEAAGGVWGQMAGRPAPRTPQAAAPSCTRAAVPRRTPLSPLCRGGRLWHRMPCRDCRLPLLPVLPPPPAQAFIALGGSPTAYCGKPGAAMTDAKLAGRGMGLVALVQMRNNARVAVAGSLHMFSDAAFQAEATTRDDRM